MTTEIENQQERKNNIEWLQPTFSLDKTNFCLKNTTSFSKYKTFWLTKTAYQSILYFETEVVTYNKWCIIYFLCIIITTVT